MKPMKFGVIGDLHLLNKTTNIKNTRHSLLTINKNVTSVQDRTFDSDISYNTIKGNNKTNQKERVECYRSFY